MSVTAEVDVADPAAAVFASRLADDRWFCWEQPDRDGFALAALGSAHEAISRGSGRFDDVAREAARVMRGRLADEPEGLPRRRRAGLDRGLRVRPGRRLAGALVVVPAGACWCCPSSRCCGPAAGPG